MRILIDKVTLPKLLFSCFMLNKPNTIPTKDNTNENQLE